MGGPRNMGELRKLDDTMLVILQLFGSLRCFAAILVIVDMISYHTSAKNWGKITDILKCRGQERNRICD